jgi:hypothetical protein
MSINDVINLSDDQMASQFQIQFPNGIPGGGSGDEIALRMDQSLDIPEEAVGEYIFYYKGLKIVRPNMIDESTKELLITVRLDQQWNIFEQIKAWKRLVHDPINGTRLPTASVSTTMLFQALDGSGDVMQTATFTNVIIKNFKVTSFENEGGDPARVEMNLLFGTADWE